MQACYLIIIPSGYDIILSVSLQIHSMCDVDPVLCKTHQEGIKVSAQEKKKKKKNIRFMQALKTEIYIFKCHMPF